MTTQHGDFSQARPTQLQVWLAVVYDALADARAELDDAAYMVFVSILCDRIGIEAGRLLLGELARGDIDGNGEVAA